MIYSWQFAVDSAESGSVLLNGFDGNPVRALRRSERAQQLTDRTCLLVETH